jgi:hypothetical protein
MSVLVVGGGRASLSGIVQCVAGDILDIRAPSSATDWINTAVLTITKVSGPSAIAANELVAVKAKRTTAQSVPNNTDTVIVFNAEDMDTHGAFDTSTGVFTAPVAGTYLVSTSMGFEAGGAGSYTNYCFFEKNNSASNILIADARTLDGGLSGYMNPSGIVKLAPGDTVRLKAYQNSGSARDTATTFIGGISLSIHRVGF